MLLFLLTMSVILPSMWLQTQAALTYNVRLLSPTAGQANCCGVAPGKTFNPNRFYLLFRTGLVFLGGQRSTIFHPEKTGECSNFLSGREKLSLCTRLSGKIPFPGTKTPADSKKRRRLILIIFPLVISQISAILVLSIYDVFFVYTTRSHMFYFCANFTIPPKASNHRKS